MNCLFIKRNTNFKIKTRIYNFLQKPTGLLAIGYQVFISCVVFTCLILTIISSIKDFENNADKVLKLMDSFILGLFSAEFLARLWSSSCVPKYRGFKGKLRFICNPLRIIDLLMIVVSSTVLFFQVKGQLLSTALRGLRIFQVFESRFRPWKLIVSVFWDQRLHLAITFYVAFLMLLFVSFIVYFAEKDVNPGFDSIAASMWWGLITLCTIGYGDVAPVTPLGKLISSICIVIGVSIFALPSGILGTGLALKVQEQQRQREINKRKFPAACLIQCAWKYYRANKNPNLTVKIRKNFSRYGHKYRPLSIQEKNAFIFILAVRFLIAKRHFSATCKPYDIKDIAEQYSNGHRIVLEIVRNMQSALHSIQTDVNLNSRGIMQLFSHISLIEETTRDISSKLNTLNDKQTNDKHLIKDLRAKLSTSSNLSYNSRVSKFQSFKRNSF